MISSLFFLGSLPVMLGLVYSTDFRVSIPMCFAKHYFRICRECSRTLSLHLYKRKLKSKITFGI